MRAALEGVCQQLALVLASMRDAGNEVHEIRATGGFARSPLWRQMLTDALGMTVGFPAGHEGSGFGAALLGMQALGLIDSIDVAAELVADRDASARARRGGGVRRPAAASPTLYDALVPAFRALQLPNTLGGPGRKKKPGGAPGPRIDAGAGRGLEPA